MSDNKCCWKLKSGDDCNKEIDVTNDPHFCNKHKRYTGAEEQRPRILRNRDHKYDPVKE